MDETKFGSLEEGKFWSIPQPARQLHISPAGHLNAVQQADPWGRTSMLAGGLDKESGGVCQQFPRQDELCLHTQQIPAH